MPKYLTLGNIKAWAASKPPDAEVGTPGVSRQCPVATYLQTCGVVEPSVGINEAFWRSRGGKFRRVTISEPVYRLVKRVDHHGPTQVTTQELLDMIQDVEETS